MDIDIDIDIGICVMGITNIIFLTDFLLICFISIISLQRNIIIIIINTYNTIIINIFTSLRRNKTLGTTLKWTKEKITLSQKPSWV